MINLPLAIALLKKNCPDCYHGEAPTRVCGCPTCNGTGKVPLLDPDLVRKPCPRLLGREQTDCSYCQSNGWVPSPDLLDWIRAVNRAGYVVMFDEVGEVWVSHGNNKVAKGATLYEAAGQAFGVGLAVEEKL